LLFLADDYNVSKGRAFSTAPESTAQDNCWDFSAYLPSSTVSLLAAVSFTKNALRCTTHT
jgi:hypothetical protein